MSFNESEELPNLVRFRLTRHILQIHDFINVRMDKNMVTSRNSRFLKPKGFDQPANVGKAGVGG